MHLRNEKAPTTIIDRILYCIAAMIVPTIILFNLYNRNHLENHLPFTQTLIISIILSIVSLVFFVVLNFILRNFEGTLIVILLLWIAFWTFESIFRVMTRFSASITRIYALLFIVGVLVFITIVFNRYSLSFKKGLTAFRVLVLCIIGMFVFNFIPAMLHNNIIASSTDEGTETIIYLKRDNFNVDITLPSPNIYWLHMDGMMSLSAFQGLTGECNEDLRQQLANRGFMIYEDAVLNAGGTNAAISFLLSPNIYDSYYHARFIEGESPILWIPNIPKMLMYDSKDITSDVFPYYELLLSLQKADYEIIMMAIQRTVFTEAPFDFFYEIGQFGPWLIDSRAQTSGIGIFLQQSWDLLSLLKLTTPISILSNALHTQLNQSQPHRLHISVNETNSTSIPGNIHINRQQLLHRERTLYHALQKSLEIQSSPRFTFVANFFAHSAYWYLQEAHPPDAMNVELYVPSYNFAVESMLNTIDMILEQNTNAVIILQSDHGIHGVEPRNQLLDMGYTEEEVLYFRLSVFSAVRIPPQYGGMDAPLAPLNISRELVNRFVGENYTLIVNK